MIRQRRILPGLFPNAHLADSPLSVKRGIDLIYPWGTALWS